MRLNVVYIRYLTIILLNNTMHWSNKYTPSKLEDFIGHKEEIKVAIKWIEEYNNDIINTPILFITGNSGTGKTIFSKLLLKTFNYQSCIFTAFDLKNKKTIENDVSKLLASNNISKFFFNKPLDDAIIMDNIDYITSTDKVTINKINNLIKKQYSKINAGYTIRKPIIFISNGRNDRKFSDIKKISTIINLTKLDDMQFIKYIKKICVKENIKIDESVLILLYKSTGYNLRQSIIYLQELYKLYSKNISLKDFLTFEKNIIKKKNEQNLFNSIHNLLIKFENVEKTVHVYDTDRCLVPMMIHQNYIKYINLKNVDTMTKIKSVTKVINNIIETDIIDHYIHNYQLWYLQKFNGINYCSKTSYEINRLQSPDIVDYNIEFTHLLSKSALQYFNYQNILLLKNFFKINKDSIIYIIDMILNNLFTNKNIDKEIEYLKSKNITISILEKMIRISKIAEYDYKILFTTSYKNKLKKIFKTNS